MYRPVLSHALQLVSLCFFVKMKLFRVFYSSYIILYYLIFLVVVAEPLSNYH